MIDNSGNKKRSVSLALKNAGFGSAQNVTMEAGETPIRANRDVDEDALRRIFAAAELQLRKANNGYEVKDPYNQNLAPK